MALTNVCTSHLWLLYKPGIAREPVALDQLGPLSLSLSPSRSRRSNNEIEKEKIMAKVVCVLYDNPVDGYPKSYPRDDLPKIDHYPDGQTLPTPKSIDFKPGTLLGSVSGELGLRKYLEFQGHKLVVTSDKDGANSVLDRELPDAEIVISQPFWPAYLTAERIAKAPN